MEVRNHIMPNSRGCPQGLGEIMSRNRRSESARLIFVAAQKIEKYFFLSYHTIYNLLYIVCVCVCVFGERAALVNDFIYGCLP